MKRIKDGLYEGEGYKVEREYALKFGRRVWYITGPGIKGSQWVPTLIEARRIVRDLVDGTQPIDDAEENPRWERL